MTSPDRARRRLQSFVALALYFALAVLLLDRGLVGHPGYYIGRDTDPPQTMWFFNWWRFSLAHGLNPFITDWVWAPLGMQPGVDDLRPAPRLDLDPSASHGRRARHLQHHHDARASARGVFCVPAVPARDGSVLAVGPGRIHLRFLVLHAWRSPRAIWIWSRSFRCHLSRCSRSKNSTARSLRDVSR